MIVLDFDKTITARDTLLGFYKYVNNGSFLLRNLKYAVYYLFMVLHKIGLISNDLLKKAGIKLFLTETPLDEIKRLSLEYAGHIEYNSVFNDYLLDFAGREDVYVLTASFEEYVRAALKKFNWKVHGSKLKTNTDGFVSGLSLNLYGENKLNYLNEVLGIRNIDTVYTDSMSDKPLIDFAKHAFLVSKNSIIQIK